MIYIEKIKFVGNAYRDIGLLDFEFQCSELNLLVGDQGCGKSTLLHLLNTHHKDLDVTLTSATIEKGVGTFFFDCEKDNPRMKNPHLYTKPNGENIGIGFGTAIHSRFLSHGEVLEKFTIKPLTEAKDCVIFLDEPESGLSISNQFRLIDAINTAISKNCQLFLSTHCYPLIEQYDVISLEHKKQMGGKEFIKLNQKKARRTYVKKVC